MDISQFLPDANEQPLERIVSNGGFCGIFRKIACIGDSLSSGEFESLMDGRKRYHDYYEYSWGQYLARDAGCTVYNFSKGGMTAREYCAAFADANNFWSIDYRAQAYIIALGENDITKMLNGDFAFGTVEDIDLADWRNNKDSFVGWYASIIQRYKEIQPKARFFLMTMPRRTQNETREAWKDVHASVLHSLSTLFEHCYVIDLRRYGPVCDEQFKKHFFLGGHLNAAGYRFTALMVESYIDYIIRNNMDDFTQIGFVGTPYLNEDAPW